MLTKNIDIMRQLVAVHIAADAVVGGIGEYWAPADNAVGGRGCFFGCLVRKNSVAALENAFGIPGDIGKIVELIFENLPQSDRPSFFQEVSDAIGEDGRDLTRVVWAFLGAELRELPKEPENIQAVIDPVIAGMDLLASGQDWPDAHVAHAAALAVYAAPSAAASAAYYAALAADRAAHAADYAADVADAAASAVDADVTQRQRNLIVRLIREAK